MKKHILTMLFVALGFITAFATYPEHQKLVYNGDTILVRLSWKSESYTPDTIPPKSIISSLITGDLFEGRQSSESPDCQEPTTTWEIIDNQLYLTGIYSCNYDEDSIKADLRSLFKERENNGKVKVDWFPATFFLRGGPGYFDYEGRYFYPTEFEFEFRNGGKLLNVERYDNSKTRISKSRKKEKTEFIYSNINWDTLPTIEEKITVQLVFSVNEEGKVDSIEQIRVWGDSNEVFIQEAIRVVKLVSDWDVLYERGKLYPIRRAIPIVFDEEYRERYGKSVALENLEILQNTDVSEEPVILINGIEFQGSLRDLPALFPPKGIYSIMLLKGSSAFAILERRKIGKYAAKNGLVIIETKANDHNRNPQNQPTSQNEIKQIYQKIPPPDDPVHVGDVDKKPTYPGGEEARMKFIWETLDYPKEAWKKGIQGRALATFVIERDGSVSSIAVIKGIGGGCDEEVIRMIGRMPKWTPGEKDGKTVRTLFGMPVSFRLSP